MWWFFLGSLFGATVVIVVVAKLWRGTEAELFAEIDRLRDKLDRKEPETE